MTEKTIEITINIDDGIESIHLTSSSGLIDTTITSSGIYETVSSTNSNFTITYKDGYTIKYAKVDSVIRGISSDGGYSFVLTNGAVVDFISRKLVYHTIKAGTYNFKKQPNLVDDDRANYAFTTDSYSEALRIKNYCYTSSGFVECESRTVSIKYCETDSTTQGFFRLDNKTPNDYAWRIVYIPSTDAYMYRFGNLSDPTDEQFETILTLEVLEDTEVEDYFYNMWSKNIITNVNRISIDLTTLTGWDNVTSGEHQISVVAKATGYLDSEKSTAVTFTKASTTKLLPAGTYRFKADADTSTTISGMPLICKGWSVNEDGTYKELVQYNVIYVGGSSEGILLANTNNDDNSIISNMGSWRYEYNGTNGYVIQPETDDGALLRTIVVETAQEVTEEFYNWTITNGNLVEAIMPQILRAGNYKFIDNPDVTSFVNECGEDS